MTDHLPAIPAEFDAWVDAATAHLYGSLDTAIDELQRDRDFLGDDAIADSPTGPARDAAIRHALTRMIRLLNDAQEA